MLKKTVAALLLTVLAACGGTTDAFAAAEDCEGLAALVLEATEDEFTQEDLDAAIKVANSLDDCNEFALYAAVGEELDGQFKEAADVLDRRALNRRHDVSPGR